ncbi:unnamed protein product [Arctia plantaginis]|uniref:Uncharacterized protein n=1 Tax=Arctia plantaginis TaxID=874455 RepID=A0A8S1B801_ARCPL|nr:unnamed protein product [Arctia plantaginis]
MISVKFSFCWQMFAEMAHFPKPSYDPDIVHSVYIYGDCKRRGIILLSHVHKEGIEIVGKLFVRGWLDINRIPTCIILKAYSFTRDLLRDTTENFQICVPRITYCHTHKRYKYYYYEWHIPYFYKGGMNWDLYFYGPPSREW